MVEGLAPPTRAVVHSHEIICRRLRIQYASLHMCGVNQFWIIVFFTAVKPANNILFCIELIQRPESSLRRHKLGLTDQSILSNDDKLLTFKRKKHFKDAVVVVVVDDKGHAFNTTFQDFGENSSVTVKEFSMDTMTCPYQYPATIKLSLAIIDQTN